MKTHNIIAVFVLTVAFGTILIFSPALLSRQVYANSEKSDLLFPGAKSIFVQEKSKYHYIGSEKCASKCHNNEEMGFQYNIWKESPHSKSYIDLNSKKAIRYAKNAGLKGTPQDNPVCLKCHITGGDLDSTFFAVTYKKDDGITCESCHKREYNPTTFTPKETDCLECHQNSVHKTPGFDFEEECVKIAHPRPKSKIKGV